MLTDDKCDFCGQPNCTSEEHIQIIREVEESIEQAMQFERSLSLRVAVSQRCKVDQPDFEPCRLMRWFYVLKYLICTQFGLDRDSKNRAHPPSVSVGEFNEFGGGYSWSVCIARVGEGVFTGWWADIEHDGECFI
ncbi:hypothetical protein KOR42_23450 [Thalassoglobus neptunius]|uniref:Uncharacterized protein n=1 Tax=Thalassoglobus neptunius TaxID=1938619 RepID=A0A5C5X808_9PLAN|nr:hypothetical protein KOR42_23450 [Thalassoglobus neptunius]